jgi:hypothetical protein
MSSHKCIFLSMSLYYKFLDTYNQNKKIVFLILNLEVPTAINYVYEYADEDNKYNLVLKL